ncbi:MAG: hypothetical protein MUF54_05070, partial [Polyangiaceae bacterium]|nr:hypothetical protein [Polyangiaceae bacterium]
MAHGSRPRVLLRSCAPARLCLLGLAWLAALLVSCGNHDASGPPCSSPSCIEVRLDKSLDPLERSAARFEHANHVKA